MPPDSTALSAEMIASRTQEASAAGIAAAVAQLIRSGEAPTGTQLPKVRDLAQILHVSSATVSAAWKTLRSRGYVEGVGRQGAWISSAAPIVGPRRFDHISSYWPEGTADLTYATPDQTLLPALPRALEFAVAEDPALHSYSRQAITPALERAAESVWPFPARHWLAVSGGYDGLLLLLQGLTSPGVRVAVADPASPRTLDILDRCGVRPVPVATDANGPLPDSADEVLSAGAHIFIYEPRCSSLLGASMTHTRRQELAEILSRHDTTIIEDDGSGDISQQKLLSLGELLPDKTVLIRSFSKSHGPDLRIGIIGSCIPRPVELARDTLHYGAGWVSRILQDTLAFLLSDDESIGMVAKARAEYASRRSALAAALAGLDVTPLSHDGLVMAVPVRDDAGAQLVLAAHRYAVASSELTRIKRQQPFIRITVGKLRGDRVENAAKALAVASQAPNPHMP
ncbi:GntR family transcriptional regulator [Brevibacterium otitidis]|uniref:GntR family transcriptional regulator n=1 Tax=Brevibacterium otitidis TaxID=53364 RepID=A0ABV5X294_9MICO|nr:aminotransferase class I/II-fold pyridoxal phosphate-dependent enzyme [Brevibacterium otitidis]